MNVQAGDIARIVHPSMYGKLVQVVELITHAWHRHPDGIKVTPDCVGSWALKSLGAPFPVIRYFGGAEYRADSTYASCNDKWLRPIRDPGEDAVDEILQKVGLPTFPLERQEA